MSRSKPAGDRVRTGFLNLPPELIQHIHLLALNPFLPHTSLTIYSILHSVPPSVIATYLLSLYADYGADHILLRALRHPVCTVAVAKEFQRIWDRRRGYIVPKTLSSSNNDGAIISEKGTASPSTDAPQLPTGPALKVSELPRRLFRLAPPPEQPIHPLLTYLFTAYTPSANSHKDYPLCRAVLTKNYALITFLLSHSADPGVRSNFAVELAVSIQDLRIVRMLVEYSTPAASKGKRRRVEDRVRVTSRLVEVAMTKGSKEIVQYFVHEKGVMPPLGSIMKLGSEVDEDKKRRRVVRLPNLPRGLVRSHG